MKEDKNIEWRWYILDEKNPVPSTLEEAQMCIHREDFRLFNTILDDVISVHSTFTACSADGTGMFTTRVNIAKDFTLTKWFICNTIDELIEQHQLQVKLWRSVRQEINESL